MKCIQLIALLLLVPFCGCAQDNAVKLYAYRQAASSGVRPAIPEDGTGQEIPPSVKESVNYYIYLAHPAGVKVYPVAMWIDGEAYGIRWQTVEQKPVVIGSGREAGQEEKATLVPSTGDAVLQLTPVEYIAGKEQRPAAALLKENQLVVVYRQGGKMHTKAVKKLQSLSRASLP